MALPVDVQRKLRQLDNDVQSIYEMLAGIAGTQTRHGNRLDELAAQLETMDTQLAANSEQLRSHGEQLAANSEQLRSHGEQLASHGGRLQEMDTKLDIIISMLDDGSPRT
ncbi:MAG: hypothetical protein ACR2MA_04630 [Egibacteraceae bacterium]